VEIYDNEEQQIEALKKWWKENGRSIIAGVIIGVGSIVGWNAWQSYKTSQAKQASDLYQQMLAASKEQKKDSVIKLSEQINTNFSATPYKALADLILARQKVENGDLEGAKTALAEVYTASPDEAIKHIARIRFLRLLLSENKHKEALKLISKFNVSSSGSFEGEYAELKGDANVGMNRLSAAKQAYQRALDLGRKSRYLGLKNDELADAAIPELSE